MDEITKEVLNYGVLGVVVLALCRYVWVLHKQSQADIDQWREFTKELMRGGQGVVPESPRDRPDVAEELRKLLESSKGKSGGR